MPSLPHDFKLHVYLAGPDVFKPNPMDVGKFKTKLLSEHGHIGHFPMDPELDDFAHNPETAYKIAMCNEKLMAQSQVILVNMTPFHGPSMDVGTAFEAGFMSHKANTDPANVLIIGYYEGEYNSNFTQRVAQQVYRGQVSQKEGRFIALDGYSIEHFGLSENLMIPGAIQKTGGRIYKSYEEAVANIQSLWQEKKNEK